MVKNPYAGFGMRRISGNKQIVMRTLLLYLISSCWSHIIIAQYPVLNNWSAGAYSRHQADIFSAGSNLASLADISGGGLAIAGQRRYGLPELDVY